MCKNPKNIFFTALLSLGISHTVLADDIDILTEILPTDSNILFIMDLSGSMQWGLSSDNNPAAGEESRIDILRGAFQDIINDTDFDNINIGLSVFSGAYQNANGYNGGAHGITYPIAPIQGTPAQTILSNATFTHPDTSYMPSTGNKNTREYLTDLSSSQLWDPLGGTPIVDALYEGVLYFRGENVDLGKYFPDDVHSAHPSTYTGSLTTIPGSCTTTTETLTRSDPTGGTNCTTNTTNRVKCDEGVNSCGLGTNCALELASPITRICDSSFTTISDCTAANPNYHSCTTEPVISCTTNAEGITTCNTTGTQIVCKEDNSRYFCDATPNTTYTCDFQVEHCDPSSTGGALTYKSPIDSECPSNGIILLTDGKPTSRTRETEIKNLVGVSNCVINDYDSDGQDDFSDWDTGAGQCGIELADFMNNTDHSAITGNQTLSLYTIGLSLASDTKTSAYLYDLAQHGGGAFISASNKAQLTEAFKQAIVGIGQKAHSFSSPTYTINTSTMLTHGENVYVPVFMKSGGSFWKGNLKKYKLSGGELYGKNNTKATDAAGNLLSDVGDLWATSTTSTSVTESGGAANKINPSTRHVYTDNGSALINISGITASQVGVSSAELPKLISFIRGENASGAPRHYMGEIIHSKPVQLMTGSGSESVVFVGTNEGFLHAIKSSTGEELFAYMPKELLKNIKPQFYKTALESHLYGVDAKITVSDDNQNGIQESGESASIYFGLRRGGKAYYSLDVSNPASPSLKWKFTHSKLGYTWSQPTLAKLKYGGSTTASKVLIFGGGYIDDNQLDSNTPDTDNNSSGVAAAVFIINADTGALISLITGADLEYAVPSKIKVIDIDRNGSADRLYFTDTGGNVLRVDLDPNKDNNISDYKLTKLASLSGTGASEKRKFFNEPDVSMFKRGGRVVIAVSVGSGQRPKPLDETVENYFYMLLDENVFNTPTTSQNIQPNDLFDAPLSSSDNLLGELAKTGGKRGWKLRLTQSGLSGEKSLSSSITFQNKVMFTTFGITSTTQSTNNGVICGVANTNKSSLYVLALLTGKPTLDLNGDNTIDSSDSPITIGPPGNIPDTPSIVRSGWKSSTNGPCTDTDCTRTFEIYTGKGPKIGGTGTLDANPIPVIQTVPRFYWIDKK